jgi:hypothetical protein
MTTAHHDNADTRRLKGKVVSLVEHEPGHVTVRFNDGSLIRVTAEERDVNGAKVMGLAVQTIAVSE